MYLIRHFIFAFLGLCLIFAVHGFDNLESVVHRLADVFLKGRTSDFFGNIFVACGLNYISDSTSSKSCFQVGRSTTITFFRDISWLKNLQRPCVYVGEAKLSRLSFEAGILFNTIAGLQSRLNEYVIYGVLKIVENDTYEICSGYNGR